MQQSMKLPAVFASLEKTSFSTNLFRMRIPSFTQRLLLALAWTLVTCIGLATMQSANAENALAPEASVSAFYKWYLKSMAANKNPLIDDRANLGKYVSSALIKEIDKQMHSPEGLDADYFIQAQDYLDDWESNIVMSKTEIKGKSASMLVTLGATKESRYRLALTLVKEGDVWKIRKIRRA